MNKRRFNPAPLRRARADDELMARLRQHLATQLADGSLLDVVDHGAEMLATTTEAPRSLAMLAVIRETRNALTVMASWWAGEALVAGFPQTAVAEALGYATSSNLASQAPDAKAFAEAISASQATGEPVKVRTRLGLVSIYPRIEVRS